MKRKITNPPKPVRAQQVPVTAQMLDEMEGRLSHKIDAGLIAIRGEMGSLNSGLKSEISGLRTEMSEMSAELRTEMSEMKTELKAEMSEIRSEIHRIGLLVEEQNARNKFVLDGYAQLYELIERKLG